MEKSDFYNKICMVLTDFDEANRNSTDELEKVAHEMYGMLTEIKKNWTFITEKN